jgi:heterodisulfide reductase subunit C1
MVSPDDKGVVRLKLKPDKNRIDDPRFKKSGYRKCIQCGRCTASCPAAYIYPDYQPRDLMRRFLFGELGSKEMGDLIWKCGQCYSCRARCPRNCTPGVGVLALRTDSVQNGKAPQEVMELSERVKNNLYTRGETILPTTLDAENMKEFGARTYERYLNNARIRARLGYGPDDSRQVPIPEGSMKDIRNIMRLTGYLESSP